MSGGNQHLFPVWQLCVLRNSSVTICGPVESLRTRSSLLLSLFTNDQAASLRAIVSEKLFFSLSFSFFSPLAESRPCETRALVAPCSWGDRGTDAGHADACIVPWRWQTAENKKRSFTFLLTGREGGAHGSHTFREAGAT